MQLVDQAPAEGVDAALAQRVAHEGMLRTRGLRVTRGRLAVLDVLAAQPHSDADAIHRGVAILEPSISVQSVHNVLGALHEAGVLRRFEPARSSARYELRVDDNHHHAVCSRCGRVEDVDCVTGEAPCLHAPAPAGFAVVQAEVTFWGLCADCAQSER